MQKRVTVAVDAMGGDNAPVEIVKGAVEAVNEHDDLKVILVGDEGTVLKELAAYTFNKDQVEVVHASEVITNNEHPVAAVRSKKDGESPALFKTAPKAPHLNAQRAWQITQNCRYAATTKGVFRCKTGTCAALRPGGPR